MKTGANSDLINKLFPPAEKVSESLDLDVSESYFKVVLNKDRKQIALCFNKPISHLILNKADVVNLIKSLSQNLSNL